MNALERRVLDRIGEDTSSPDVFTEGSEDFDQIRGSINDAIEEISIVTGGVTRKYYLPLEEGQTFYRIKLENNSFGWVKDAWLYGQDRRLVHTDLVRLNKHDPRWMITRSTPDSYLQIGLDIIGFYPRSGSDSDVVELTLVIIPEAISDDDDKINLRDIFERATVHYAVSEYWASRGNAGEAIVHYKRYLKLLGLYDETPSLNDRIFQYKTDKATNEVR